MENVPCPIIERSKLSVLSFLFKSSTPKLLTYRIKYTLVSAAKGRREFVHSRKKKKISSRTHFILCVFLTT